MSFRSNVIPRIPFTGAVAAHHTSVHMNPNLSHIAYFIEDESLDYMYLCD